jgi:hypothetical protein
MNSNNENSSKHLAIGIIGCILVLIYLVLTSCSVSKKPVDRYHDMNGSFSLSEPPYDHPWIIKTKHNTYMIGLGRGGI